MLGNGQIQNPDPLSHPCFSEPVVRAVSEVSSRFLKDHNIRAFEFARVFDNGTAVILYSNPLISEYVIKNKVHITAHVPKATVTSQFWHIPSKDGPYQPLVRSLKEIAGTGGFVDFIQRFGGFYDMFCFLTQEELDVAANKFINLKEQVEDFSLSARDRMKEMISTLTKSPLNLPQEMRPNFGGLTFQDLSQMKTRFRFRGESIRQELEVLLAQTKKLAFTRRELDCLVFISKGQTAKEIANELGLSYRTVEQHIISIKGKLNCEKKSQIGDYLEKILNSKQT